MSFVKVNEDNRGGVQYVDPEMVSGYSIERETFGWALYLHAPGKHYQLNSPAENSDLFESPEEAQEYLESWFVSVMEGVEELKRKRATKYHIGRDPQLGDIFRILDNYWEVIQREPGGDTPLITIKVLLSPAGFYDGRKFTGVKEVQRHASWFTDENAQFVGNREDFEQSMEQLMGVWKGVKPFLSHYLDGFTGREQIVVHYGDEASGQVYCCDREFKFAKGHAFTHDPERVTCPEYIRVTHYANARDNETRCCGKKYPLSEGETWTENANTVNCPEFKKGNAVKVQPCEDKSPHEYHTYVEGEATHLEELYCEGVPVSSEHDA